MKKVEQGNRNACLMDEKSKLCKNSWNNSYDDWISLELIYVEILGILYIYMYTEL